MNHEPVMHPLRRVEARLDTSPWPWAATNRREIERHWDRLTAANPSLYNGDVLVAADRCFTADTLDVRFRSTDYASFLMHRDQGFPDPGAGNCFGMAALRSADGAYLLGVMAPHTANAGRIYFPAGTPEPADVLPDGRVDLLRNVMRELTEETGLAPTDVAIGDGWTAVVEGGRTALMRDMTSELQADALRQRVRDFLASERQPEFVDVRMIRAPVDIDVLAVPAFVQTYLRHGLRGSS